MPGVVSSKFITDIHSELHIAASDDRIYGMRLDAREQTTVV